MKKSAAAFLEGKQEEEEEIKSKENIEERERERKGKRACKKWRGGN